jgi:hypothetical protein
MKRLLIVIFLAVGFSVFGQVDTIRSVHRLIQLSGVVVSSDSLQEMPYAAVYNRTVRRGTMADIYGFFSLVVQPGDTIMFRYYGHKPSSYIVPDTLTDDRYSIIHMMEVDTMEIDEVIIYPWPSKEAFAQAFITMNPYDDALMRVQKQLSGQSLAELSRMVPTDASLSFGNVTNQQNTRLYTMGQSPVNNLMNPFAWASFLQKWRSGELQRQ